VIAPKVNSSERYSSNMSLVYRSSDGEGMGMGLKVGLAHRGIVVMDVGSGAHAILRVMDISRYSGVCYLISNLLKRHASTSKLRASNDMSTLG
jgi:hypothetical protein